MLLVCALEELVCIQITPLDIYQKFVEVFTATNSTKWHTILVHSDTELIEKPLHTS